MWRDDDVRSYGEGTKRIKHPRAGVWGFEYSALLADGRPDLGMVIYTPAASKDAERIRKLIGSQSKRS